MLSEEEIRKMNIKELQITLLAFELEHLELIKQSTILLNKSNGIRIQIEMIVSEVKRRTELDNSDRDYYQGE